MDGETRIENGCQRTTMIGELDKKLVTPKNRALCLIPCVLWASCR